MGPIPSVSLSRRAKIALSVVAIVLVLLILVVKFSGVYINYLWFGEVGHRNVYRTVLWTKVSLFFIFGVLMALIIGANIAVAYVTRPPFRPMSPEQQNLQHYVMMVEPRRRLALGAVMLVALLAAGASAQGNWSEWQVWLHGTSFGVKDPLFHRDISFFAWDYPVYRTLLGFGFTAVIFSLILAVGVHYLTGAIRLQTPGPKITMAARRQLTILLFFFIALKAVAYWLDRYGMVFSERSDRFTGASYTDVHSALPARTILFWIAVVLAIAVLASLWLHSSLLPGIGFVVLIVFSILIGGIYPAIVQQVSVKPNASTKEVPYIKDNIAATRQAYDIVTKTAKNAGTVSYQPYDVSTSPSASALTGTSPTVSNLRILDPNVLSPTFAQQQAQVSNIYGFPAKLDVDRYDVAGQTSDYIVGVRELDAANLRGQQTNWINEYTNYTHGYGFVAASADTNVTLPNGPAYADGEIPPTGTLNDSIPVRQQPEVYYGELMSPYAIVGAKGTPREFNGDGDKKITYAGTGGISLSSPFTKLAFAIHDKETNFLLNSAVSAPGARVLINRDPRARLAKVAPFLKIDGDPYPILDSKTGHIVWMLDAYTTMDNYPYSERHSLSGLTSDSLTSADKTAGQPNDQVNYIRNSVKATVDAYDGTVHLYDWDKTDPVLKTWMKVFPDLVQPKSDMPSAIRAHVRYPEDLFEAQRSLLEDYHVSNPVTFFNVGNRWTVPTDPAQGAVGEQPPYYVVADAGGTSSAKAQFQLTSPMKVNTKTNLAAYITVDSDPGKDYGKMTVLTVPNGSVIAGPQQVANTFNSKDVVSSYRKLQSGAGSTLVEGNLLTLPIGNSFLFVEPLYIQAQSSGFPELQRVLTYYGGNVGFGATLSAALSDLQPGHSTGQSLQTDGSSSDDVTPTPSGNTSTAPPSSSSSPPSSSGSPSSGATGRTAPGMSVDSLLTQVNDAKTALDNAYDTHDQARIITAQAKYDRLSDELVSALNKSASATPNPTVTPSK